MFTIVKYEPGDTLRNGAIVVKHVVGPVGRYGYVLAAWDHAHGSFVTWEVDYRGATYNGHYLATHSADAGLAALDGRFDEAFS